MYQVPVLLGGTRKGGHSRGVAICLERKLRESEHFRTELLDLGRCDLPMLDEPYASQANPSDELRSLHEKLAGADALVIVTPEYNHGYPGVLKNALDYFRKEYRRKPVGIVTVSSGSLGGNYCLTQLRTVVLALGAIPVPADFQVTKVQESIDQNGEVLDPTVDRRSAKLIGELLWWTEAVTEKKRQERMTDKPQ